MNIRAVAAASLEFNHAVNQSKQGMVAADANAFTRVMFCTALTHDDVTGDSFLTTEQFNAKALAYRVAAVLGTTYTFLVCHFVLCLRLNVC